jgi:uncharacterized iron-regulated protein
MRFLGFIPIAAFFILFTGGCFANKVLVIPGGTEVELPRLIEDIGGASVIFIGESHKTRRHHRFQLEVIDALHSGGVKLAIGLEMFKAGSQDILDLWVAGGVMTDVFIKEYYKNWHVPWSQYRDILIYARDNKIPVVALNVSRGVILEVFSEEDEEGEEDEEDGSARPEDEGAEAEEEGARPARPAKLAEQEAVYIEELKLVGCDVDPEYEKFLRDVVGEHEGMEIDFDRFCRSQMIWDTVMAMRATEYLEQNPDRTMVVLTGGVHAWKRAIPRKLKRFSKDQGLTYIVIVPEVREGVDRHNVTTDDTDYLLLNPWMW